MLSQELKRLVYEAHHPALAPAFQSLVLSGAIESHWSQTKWTVRRNTVA